MKNVACGPLGSDPIAARKRAFEILELSEAASVDEVKRSYRRQSLTRHPDRGGSDVDFQLLHAAYELAMSKSAYPIASFVCSQPPAKHQISLSLREVYEGSRRIVSVIVQKLCQRCFFSGPAPSICNKCSGTGTVALNNFTGFGSRTCLQCRGTGAVGDCSVCGGKRTVPYERRLEIALPPRYNCSKPWTRDGLGHERYEQHQLRVDPLTIHFSIQQPTHSTSFAFLGDATSGSLKIVVPLELADALCKTSVEARLFAEHAPISIPLPPLGELLDSKKTVVTDRGLFEKSNLYVSFDIVYPVERADFLRDLKQRLGEEEKAQ
jgi:DnaJ-class molecular chaperone